jgi:hypothetical protein
VTVTGALRTDERFERPDDLYEMLIEAHRDLGPEQSRLLNAKLMLLLANHVGDVEVVRDAIAAAREGLAGGPPAATSSSES